MTAPSSPGPAAPQDAEITWDTLPDRSWLENMQPTPEQLAEWMVALSRDELVWYLGQHLSAWDRHLDCFIRNHEGHLAELTAEVERLRAITEAARDTRFPDGEVYVSYEMYDHALTLCVEAETERDALRRQVDAAWDGEPGGTAPWGVPD